MKHTIIEGQEYSPSELARMQYARDMDASGQRPAPVVYVPAVGEWVNVTVDTDANTGARAGIDQMRDAEGKRHYRAWGSYDDTPAYASPVYEVYDQADANARDVERMSDIPVRDAEVAQAAVARHLMNPATQASYGDMLGMMAEGMHKAKMLYSQRRREEREADRRAAYDLEARRIGALVERYAELKALDATPAPEVQQ